MNSFRFAIFAAVSTDEQAQDHDSLSNQVRDGRTYAERLGGVEACAPFIADGYSRSFYEGLSEAMAEIPPLKDAIQAAEHNQYDVLIVRYFERLGVVAYPVFLRLGKLKKQIRSVQEPTPIVPPEIYDPAKDEATSTMIHLAGLKQDYRINRLINNLRENMPKRIREGLTPARMAYGYNYVSNKKPPELDPTKAAKLIQARDMLLGGESYSRISDFLGIDRSRVPSVLGNPYYTGQVSYNKTYIQRLGTKRKQISQPKSKWTIGAGKHQPIFTQLEHEEILAEIQRRVELMRHHEVSSVFSGLLTCGVCGGRARRAKFGTKGKYKEMVVCRKFGARHIRWTYDEFMDEVVVKILDELEGSGAGEDQTEDKTELILKAIEANKKQRSRVQEGFQSGVYDTAEASAKLRELENEQERLYKKMEKDAISKASHSQAGNVLEEIAPVLWDYLSDPDNTKRVNSLLAAWLQEIQIGNKEIKVIKR